jgi:hypothetical protein
LLIVTVIGSLSIHSLRYAVHFAQGLGVEVVPVAAGAGRAVLPAYRNGWNIGVLPVRIIAMINGSCLCGTVKFQVDGAFENMSHCHCSMCRKAHGAAFATYATCSEEAFRWQAGEEAVMRRESSPGFYRTFCTHCGTSLPITSKRGVHVPAGCLDDDPQIRPQHHIFAEFAAPWHVMADGLPQHENWDLERTVFKPRRDPNDKSLYGSCLCGDVKFTIAGPINRAHNCHCSRCRKARAAAHNSNAFTATDDVQFSQGEDKVQTFKLPEAQFFAVAFCRTCGSSVPRKDPQRGIAVVPMGALDDDPKRTVDSHIFMASRACWYDPQDDLPKFDEFAS